jgi:hypothetical protein
MPGPFDVLPIITGPMIGGASKVRDSSISLRNIPGEMNVNLDADI